jgi:hypothetical protein
MMSVFDRQKCFRALLSSVFALRQPRSHTQCYAATLIHASYIRNAVAQFDKALRPKPKVAGSIPDDAIRIFHLLNPSRYIVALRRKKTLIAISNKDIAWG